MYKLHIILTNMEYRRIKHVRSVYIICREHQDLLLVECCFGPRGANVGRTTKLLMVLTFYGIIMPPVVPPRLEPGMYVGTGACLMVLLPAASILHECIRQSSQVSRCTHWGTFEGRQAGNQKELESARTPAPAGIPKLTPRVLPSFRYV